MDEPVKLTLKLEAGGCCISISPSDEITSGLPTDARKLAAPDWSKIIAIATCVITCIGASKGGAVQNPKKVDQKEATAG